MSKPYGRESLARKIRQVLELRLPAQAAAEPVRADPPQEGLRVLGLRVLVVEDEALIRMLLAEMLVDMGHRVQEAATVVEATAQLAAAAFDVLVTDVSLPDGSGIALATAAMSRDPNLRIVIASGRIPDRASWPTSCVVLEEPYDEARLRAAMAQATSQ